MPDSDFLFALQKLVFTPVLISFCFECKAQLSLKFLQRRWCTLERKLYGLLAIKLNRVGQNVFDRVAIVKFEIV